MNGHSKRWQQKTRTRRALSEAALYLFQEHGFDAVTTEAIAAAAGVTQRTFFRHFPCKEAAAFPYHEALMERLRSGLAERPLNEPILHSIREAVMGLAEVYDDYEVYHQALRLMRTTPQLLAYGHAVVHRAWINTIADYVAMRLDVDRRFDMRAETAAEAAAGAFSAAITRWLAVEGREPLIDLAVSALDLLDSGFALDEPAPVASSARSV